MAALRVGIIGAGNIAQKSHIPAFQNYSEPVEVVAVCGRNLPRLQTVQQQFNIAKVYTDLDQMLKESKLDILSVCTPNNLHFENTMMGLEAGCHVLCEKPPALSYEEAKKMAEKAKQTNRFLGYNFTRRCLREMEILKRYINAGDFGDIYHIRAIFSRRRGIPGWGSFTNIDIQGGGALMDIGIHILDAALYISGYPEAKTVLGNIYDHIGKKGGVGMMGPWDPSAFTVEDACFAHIQLKNGPSITLETAFALNTAVDKNVNLEIYGTKMGATLHPFRMFTEQHNELVNVEFPFLPEVNVHRENIHRFIDACIGKPSVVCTASEGAAIQKIIDAIYTSARHQKAVDL